MKFCKLIYSVILVFLFTSYIYAQSEDDLDSEFLSDEPSTVSEGLENEAKWEIFGYFKNDNQFSVSREKRVKEFEIIKLEARGHLSAKYGTDEFYGKAVLDMFYYPEINDSSNDNQWENPHDSGVLEAQELYIGGGNKFRFKIGKQLFSWGTGDAFQVTNYLDQPDLREFFASDKDDQYRGVFSLSLKYLIGDYAIEAVASPEHNRPLLPSGFWELEPPQVQGFNVEIKDEEPADRDLSRSSFVIRGGGTIGVLDFHASYFNGISNSLVFKPEIKDMTTICMKPYYDRVQTFGVDLSFTIDKLAVRAEAAFTTDMPGIPDPQNGRTQAEMLELISADAEEKPFVAYVTGMDYNLWGNNGLLLIEWMQSMYLKNPDRYMEPFMTDLLLVRISDKFFNENLEAEVNAIIRPVQIEPGYGIMYELKWNFQNGLTIAAGGIFFTGNDDDLLEFFDKKDMVFLEGKMEF